MVAVLAFHRARAGATFVTALVRRIDRGAAPVAPAGKTSRGPEPTRRTAPGSVLLVPGRGGTVVNPVEIARAATYMVYTYRASLPFDD